MPLSSRPSSDNRAEWHPKYDYSQKISDQTNYEEVRVVKLADKIKGKQQRQVPRHNDDRDVEIDKLRRELSRLKTKLEHTEKDCDYLRELAREQKVKLAKYAREKQELEKFEDNITDSKVDRASDVKLPNDSRSQKRLNDRTTSHPDSPNGKKPNGFPNPPELKSYGQDYHQGSWGSPQYNRQDYYYRYPPERYQEYDPYYSRRPREVYRPRDPYGYYSDPYYQSRDYGRPFMNYDPRKGGYSYPNYPEDMWTNSQREYISGYDRYGRYDWDQSAPNPNHRRNSTARRYPQGSDSECLHAEQVHNDGKVSAAVHNDRHCRVFTPENDRDNYTSYPIKKVGVVSNPPSDQRRQLDPPNQQRSVEVRREDGRQYPVSHARYQQQPHPHAKQLKDNQQPVGREKPPNQDANDSSNISLSEVQQEGQNALLSEGSRILSREGKRQPHSYSRQEMVKGENPIVKRDWQKSITDLSSSSSQSRSQSTPENPHAKQGGQNSNIKTAPHQGGSSEGAIPSNQHEGCMSNAEMQNRVIDASSKISPSSMKSETVRDENSVGRPRVPSYDFGIPPTREIAEDIRARSCPSMGHNRFRASKLPVRSTATSARSASPRLSLEKALPKKKVKALIMGPHDPTQEAGPMEMKMAVKNRKRKSSGRARGGGHAYGRRGEGGR